MKNNIIIEKSNKESPRRCNRMIYVKEGSATIEAAYILPMVIGFVLALIYFSIYIYDMSAATGILEKNLSRYQSVTDRDELILKEIEEKTRQDMKETLIACTEPKLSISVKKEEISASCQGQVNFPLSRLFAMDFKARSLVKRIEPVEFIRDIRRVVCR